MQLTRPGIVIALVITLAILARLGGMKSATSSAAAPQTFPATTSANN